jgi:hypothetical protein
VLDGCPTSFPTISPPDDDDVFDSIIDSSSPTMTPDAEVFDPILNEWEALPDPPGKMSRHGYITAARLKKC